MYTKTSFLLLLDNRYQKLKIFILISIGVFLIIMPLTNILKENYFKDEILADSITLQPTDEIIETTNVNNLYYSFGDGSKVNLSMDYELSEGSSLALLHDKYENKYIIDKQTNAITSIRYKDQLATGNVLSKIELEKLSNLYLNKIIGENNYRLVEIDNGNVYKKNNDHSFNWTKYINNIPIQSHEVVIYLSSDGNIKNVFIRSQDTNENSDTTIKMISQSKTFISEEKAVEIADNTFITIENGKEVKRSPFEHQKNRLTTCSKLLFFDLNYDFVWSIKYWNSGHVYYVIINANTGEIIEINRCK